ncbi:hypothetical protein RvY_12766 [Ramazzottius varieornatus]|uniref:Lipoprotein n=1 Tax=Ramazzottius varieornatus TaxID=947166 RepID=A0A1D1VUA9_RAMVA|nr:hypothetical protein RvY_12766 [Ramazzottius varieornatus]
MSKMLYQAVFLSALVAMVACARSSSTDGTRVEYKLFNFTHAGKLQNGEKCDFGTHCDPSLRGYVDTISPDAAFPGSEDNLERWAKIWEGLDIKDTARLNKIVSRDVCKGTYNKATLRVQVDEVDSSRKDLMEQFMCYAGRNVQQDESRAKWSELAECEAHYNKRGNKMLYSWRAFTVPARDCGKV